MPPGHRQGLLSVIMLAALLASVGGAMLLVRGTRQANQRGQEVIAEIRQKGLAAFWGSRTVDLWFLGTDARGKTQRWQRIARRPVGESYVGTQAYGDESGRVAVEAWRINADATAGSYEGSGGREVGLSDIAIHLRDGTVAVQLPPPHGQTVSSPAPANYIPEGLDSLFCFMASKQRQEAAGRMVLNDQALFGDSVRFWPVRVTHDGSGRVHVRPGGAPELIYTFNQEGLPEKIELAGRMVYTRATRQEALRLFPYLRGARWLEALDRLGGDEGDTPAADAPGISLPSGGAPPDLLIAF